MSADNFNLNAYCNASDVARARANSESALNPCGPTVPPCTGIGPKYGIVIGAFPQECK